MTIEIKPIGAGTALVDVRGTLDAHTHAELEKRLRELIERGRVKIIAQLDHLTYISSAGAGVFVGAAGAAREKGGDIVFLRPQAAVREVFDLLGLSQIFEYADDRESALLALK